MTLYIELEKKLIFNFQFNHYLNVWQSSFNPSMHNVKKWPKYTLKILQCKYGKFFKECLAIFKHFVWKLETMK